MRNSFTTRRVSNWAPTTVHRCHGCGQDFRGEHQAAFHECDRRQDDVPAKFNLVGLVDERGEICTRPLNSRGREYAELGGLDLVFTMHARAFSRLLEEAESTIAHGTPHEQGELLSKLVNLLKEAK